MNRYLLLLILCSAILKGMDARLAQQKFLILSLKIGAHNKVTANIMEGVDIAPKESEQAIAEYKRFKYTGYMKNAYKFLADAKCDDDSQLAKEAKSMVQKLTDQAVAKLQKTIDDAKKARARMVVKQKTEASSEKQ